MLNFIKLSQHIGSINSVGIFLSLQNSKLTSYCYCETQLIKIVPTPSLEKSLMALAYKMDIWLKQKNSSFVVSLEFGHLWTASCLYLLKWKVVKTFSVKGREEWMQSVVTNRSNSANTYWLSCFSACPDICR